MRRPAIGLTCCLCRRPAGQAGEIYAVDAEWQRRFPEMTGMLACRRCVKRRWCCRPRAGVPFPAGHILSVKYPGMDFDSWDHILRYGTPAAMVTQFPEAGIVQGAGEYLRYMAGRDRGNPVLKQGIREAVGRAAARAC
jgi:hypothetical protein